MKQNFPSTKFHGSTWAGPIIALVLLITSITPASAVIGVLERASVNSAEAQATGASTYPSISADNCLIAFESTAADLVAGDSNGVSDVFVRNRCTGDTILVSATSGGISGNGASESPAISADGNFVAFRSAASDLVAVDTNGDADIFIRNLTTNSTTLVSVASDETQANNEAFAPSISSNGQFVAFFSYATNLVFDACDCFDVFVRDVVAGTTELISVDSTELQGNNQSTYCSISGDGRYVAFQSEATNLITGDTNGTPDIFVRDRTGGTTIRASVSTAGGQGAGDSYLPSISANGQFVAFQSSSYALVPDDDNSSFDIIVRDILNNTTARASVNNSGLNRPGDSTQASISADGRYVAFTSLADLINVVDDPLAFSHIYVRDLTSGVTTRISVDSGANLGNAESSHPALSSGGRYLAFQSVATNLVSGDSNATSDIFYADSINVEDVTPPGITSIQRLTPSGSPTNATTLVFRATFTEAVTGVDELDFTINATPATTATITAVTAFSSSVYDITVSGGDLSTYNGTIGLNIPGSVTITDLALNAFSAAEPTTDEIYVLDHIVPDVTINPPLPPEYTSVNSATFNFSSNDPTATFLCSLDDLTYTPCSSPKNYTSTDLGQNTWTFRVKAVDSAGNITAAPATYTWTIDWTAPFAVSIERYNPSNPDTNADSLIFRVTFDDDVTGVGTGDFATTASGATATLVDEQPNSVFYVTVSGGSLASYNGVVGLTYSDTPTITDLAGNNINTTLPSGEDYETYLVDNIAPTITSFTRQSPSTTPTNSDTLVFQALFSETVTGVGITDFAVDGSSTASVSAVTGSGTTYAITVSGGDLDEFDGVVGLNFNAPVITDLAGNPLAGTEPSTDQIYTLDNTAPWATSFAYNTPASSPTNATTLIYQVTFSESVSNVEATDFTVAGGSTAGVTGLSGSGTTYLVTISGGNLSTFSGDVNLNFVAGPTIQDAVGNLLTNTTPVSEAIYVLDHTPPTVTHIQRNSPTTSPTNADTLIYEVIFSESVTGVQNTDFVVTGGTSATATAISGSGTNFLVTISGGNLADFNGNVNLDLISSPGISDGVGNLLTNTTPGSEQVYLVDNIVPTVTSFTYQTPATSPTNADTLTFQVFFSEVVMNVGTADFAVNSSATATVSAVTGTGTTYAVTVSGIGLANFNGTVGLNFNAPVITDLAGNPLASTEPGTDQIYTLDNIAPATQAFARHDPLTNPTNSDSLVFRIIFSEDVLGVDTADLTVDGSTAGLSNFTTISPTTYEVTLSGGNLAGLTGDVGLNIAASVAITDLAGNPLPSTEPGTDQTYTLDNTAPAVTSFVLRTPATSPTNADTLTFRATFSEPVNDVAANDFTASASGASVSSIATISSTVYDVTLSGGTLASYNGAVGLNVAASVTITDAVGNSLPAADPSIDQTYMVDNTAPATVSFVRQSPTANPTNANALTFRATFNESVTGVDAADFTASATTASVSGVDQISPTVYDVTISGGTLTDYTGDVELNFTSGMAITDLAGNALPPTEPVTDQVYTLDNTAPTALSSVRRTPSASSTNADTLVFRVTFSEPVTGVDNADFVPSASTASVTVSVVSATVYDVTLSGGNLAGFNGIVGLNIPIAVSITDAVGNALPVAEPGTDETYNVDNDAPDTIIDTHPANPTNDTSATFTFHSTETPSIFACQLDLSGYSPCTSGKNYPSLDEGTHTFYVRATDEAGNTDIIPATYTWTIDLTAPTVTITSHPDNPTNSTTATFEFSGENVVSFTCSLDGATATTCTSPKQYPGLTAGSHTFNVYGVDSSGNQGGDSYAWTIDLTAPTATSFTRSNPTAELTNADTLVFQVTFSETVSGVAAADFAVDGATTATITTVNPVSGSVYTVTLSGGDLANFNGEVGLNLAASPSIQDTAGNGLTATEPGTDETYLVDNMAPTTTIVSHPDPLSPTDSATFTFTGADNESATADLTYECSLDGGAFEDCTSPKTYTALAIGEHTFEVRAIDELGHVDATPETFTWTVARKIFLPLVRR